ncbi:MAG TPA: BatA and WFA domain-containing protein [Planctomycetaceae bacterium]|nr:BatA and WFA domain-containing protein [Planctomycetaceae bacterium]
MSWPGFYALANAWWFLLLVPLVVFYFLKLKRPRIEIPSLALWRSVINDQRVNSPFQKFKRNILLLLQILLLMLLVAAAMQPFIQAGPDRAARLPVLIDCSASMAALDERGGRSRLDAAKDRVRELIDSLPPYQQISLIAFHSSARRLTEFTDNRRVLLDALAQLEVADVPSNPVDALRMTHALARTVSADTPIEKVLMVTDGNVPAEVEFDLPFSIELVKLPPAGQNIGITALNARRAGESDWEVFVRIEGSTHAEGSAAVEILQDGEPAGSEPVLIEPGRSERVVFRVDGREPTGIEVRLKPAAFDSLEADNVAFLALEAARPLVVYAPTELPAYRHALQAIEGVELYPDDEGRGEAVAYDLLITEGPDDRETPAVLSVGFVPDELKDLVTVSESGAAEIVDWDRSDPLLQHVHLGEVLIADVPEIAPDTTPQDFEELGYELLVHSRTGPLALKRRVGSRTHYLLLFHTDHSTLPHRIGFPILVANLVELARHQGRLAEARGDTTGVLPRRTLEPDTTYTITGPAGQRVEIPTRVDGVLSGVPAPRVGVYGIRGGGDNLKVGASLLDSGETSLFAIDKIRFGELSVEAATETLDSDFPLWGTLALIGFGLLVIEWWVYQRRPARVAA